MLNIPYYRSLLSRNLARKLCGSGAWNRPRYRLTLRSRHVSCLISHLRYKERSLLLYPYIPWSHILLRLELASDMELWTRFFQYSHPYTLSVPLGIFQMSPGQRSEMFRHRYFVEAYRVIQRLKTLGIDPFRHPHPEETRLPIAVELA